MQRQIECSRFEVLLCLKFSGPPPHWMGQYFLILLNFASVSLKYHHFLIHMSEYKIS